MTDPDWRAEEAANAVHDEQESNARAAGDGGPRDEDSAGAFAEEAADETAESAQGAPPLNDEGGPDVQGAEG